jgi:hypothetical protein
MAGGKQVYENPKVSKGTNADKKMTGIAIKGSPKLPK